MNQKKRLTYILHDIAVGGVEVALISAIPALHKKFDLRVIVLGCLHPAMIKHLSEDEKGAFTAFDYPLHKYPLVLPKILRYILRDKPDILICSLWRAALVAILLRRLNPNFKFYSFVHNTRFPHRLAHYFIKSASQQADCVLTDSIATKRFVEADFKPRGEIKVISFLTRETNASIRKVAPVTGEEVRFVFLGRINKVKNLPAAIRLIRSLKDESIHATLDIFGNYDERSAGELTTLIEELQLKDFVHLKGAISGDDRWPIFSRYHFYLQLSFFEGMAMSVTEAMQNGLVCIVTPVGEIVNYSEDMISAVFIDILNEHSWQSNVDKVLSVIHNQKLYNNISAKCHQNFVGKKLYTDSLISELGF